MTMKAALLKAFGSPLVVETLPDPVLGTGRWWSMSWRVPYSLIWARC